MSGWAKAWIGWGMGFAAIEAVALRNRHARGTLSEHIRTVFGFDSSGPHPELRRLGFVGIWLWFGAHIALKPHGCDFRPPRTRPPT